MRILMLARHLPAEGSTTQMYTLASGLIAQGHEVAIASAGHDGSSSAIRLFDQATRKGIQHIVMPFPRGRSIAFFGNLAQAARYLTGMPISLVRIYRWKPDVIHVHYPVTSYLAAAYRTMTGTRFVTTHHISGIPNHPLLRSADLAIAISHDLQNELASVFRYPPAQIVPISNGVDHSRFTGLKLPERSLRLQAIGLSESEERSIIGFIGTITRRKGLDVLLDAVSDIDRSRYHLVIVGDGDVTWLNEIIEGHDLGANVTIAGFSEPEPYYAAFDIFVLPSRREGFGLVSVEAMMSGVLTVRSRVEGAQEQIEHGVSGLLFENENSVELRSILARAIEDPSGYEEIARRGKTSAIEMFSAESMVDRYTEVYSGLLESQR